MTTIIAHTIARECLRRGYATQADRYCLLNMLYQLPGCVFAMALAALSLDTVVCS